MNERAANAAAHDVASAYRAAAIAVNAGNSAS